MTGIWNISDAQIFKTFLGFPGLRMPADRAMIMGQELEIIERMYDNIAKEYSEVFWGEHEKKPKDQEILRRFSMEYSS